MEINSNQLTVGEMMLNKEYSFIIKQQKRGLNNRMIDCVQEVIQCKTHYAIQTGQKRDIIAMSTNNY